MMSYKSKYLVLTIILCTVMFEANARSWDFAVVIGQSIDFFSANRTLTGQIKIAEAVALRGAAYDSASKTMYLSDYGNNVTIFANHLTRKDDAWNPVIKKSNGERSAIFGLVFDASIRTLFWTDAIKNVIMKMHIPLNGTYGEPIILHDVPQASPQGIALDMCNKRIYWTNANKTMSSIERSNYDGSDRVTVIQKNLDEPLGLAIDHANQKLYWTDDVEGISFKIERSNLDGSNRELLLHGKHHQPEYLAVDHDFIYWADWVDSAIWTIPKRPGEYPIQLKSYRSSNPEADPAQIITRDSVENIDCTPIYRMINDNLDKMMDEPKITVIATMSSVPVPESFNNLTTSNEELDSVTETSRSCLNGGILDGIEGVCRCSPGFAGSFCEISLCYNYCLKGKCTINSRGAPECQCPDGYNGLHCEKNLCDSYCLNDGRCSIQNGKPYCICNYTKGARCENAYNIVDLCELYCTTTKSQLVSFNISSCRCTEMNHTSERIINFTGDDFEYKILLPILTALIVSLVILVIVLSIYVANLRRRPRIRKRFVVSKGVTPLTSRPQIQDQCEITIENCCNMNICETPCFEPKLRNAGTRSNNSKKAKEEKNSLLDNMEGNSC